MCLIKLPNFKKAWDYENDFLSSCENSRIAKILAHYELFKMASKKQIEVGKEDTKKYEVFVKFSCTWERVNEI